MKNIIILSILTIFFYSCDHFRPPKVDKLYSAFSNYNITFNKEGGDTLIYALVDYWRFDSYIQIDTIAVRMPRCDDVFPNSEPPVQKAGTCTNDILTVKYDFLQKYIEPVLIEGHWFKITKKSLREVSIVVSPNLSGKIRKVILTPDRNGTRLVISQVSN